MSHIVGLGPCYHAVSANFKFDVAFCRNTRPRNRPDFVENGGNVWGAVAQLPSEVASVCDTRYLKYTPS